MVYDTRNDRIPTICNKTKFMIPKPVIAAELGQELAKERKTASLSQVELAEKLNVSPSTISSMERGKMLPSVLLLLQYCKEVGCPLSAVLLNVETTLRINT